MLARMSRHESDAVSSFKSSEGTSSKPAPRFVTHAEMLEVIEMIFQLASATIESPVVLESVLEALRVLEAKHGG